MTTQETLIHNQNTLNNIVLNFGFKGFAQYLQTSASLFRRGNLSDKLNNLWQHGHCLDVNSLNIFQCFIENNYHLNDRALSFLIKVEYDHFIFSDKSLFSTLLIVQCGEQNLHVDYVPFQSM